MSIVVKDLGQRLEGVQLHERTKGDFVWGFLFVVWGFLFVVFCLLFFVFCLLFGGGMEGNAEKKSPAGSRAGERET